MNYIKPIMLVSLIFLIGCLPIASTGGVVENPQAEAIFFADGRCQSGSGFWLEQLLEKSENSVFPGSWLEILQQRSCNVTELKDTFDQVLSSGFPANPVPINCWVNGPYKPGFQTIFCDKFDDNSNRWPTDNGSGSLALTGTAVQDGKLVVDISGFSADGDESAVLHFLPPMAYAGDFLLSATARIDSDLPQVAWGLAFEGNTIRNSRFRYLFILSKSGQYSLSKFEGSILTPVLTPKRTDVIHVDGDNTIRIVNEGSHYTFFINDVQVESMDLSPLGDTGIMLAVSAGAGANAEISFDNLLVQSPDSIK